MDDDVSRAVFERHLARLGQLQIPLVLAGVITGVSIYAPVAVYGYSEFLRSGAISIWIALIVCLIGGS